MSEYRMPETLVSMAPNGPLYSLGASGFGSHVSRWLGPPWQYTSRICVSALGTAGAAPAARPRKTSVKARLPIPNDRRRRRERGPGQGLGGVIVKGTEPYSILQANMRILITGSCGFIGRELIRE